MTTPIDFSTVVRRCVELSSQIDADRDTPHTNAAERLLNALNPTGLPFPGTTEAAIERSSWRDGAPTLSSGAGGWIDSLRRTRLVAETQDALWTIAVGLADVRGAKWYRESPPCDPSDDPTWDTEDCDSLARSLLRNGLALFSAGARQLWQDLPSEAHESVADLLPDVVRIWDWSPQDAATDSTALLRLGEIGGRLIGLDWANLTPGYDRPADGDDHTNAPVFAVYSPQCGGSNRVYTSDCVSSDAGTR